VTTARPCRPDLSLDLARLGAAYAAGERTPVDVIDTILARIEARGDDGVWISRVPAPQVFAHARTLAERGPMGLPLYGVPVAVKDNIDVAGLPTTAACPAYAYTPDRSATAVQRLVDAGAIVIGKTNLDQFATGLVGVRTPHGVARNPFDSKVIPGGSSSGSAVAVAAGLVSLALGTDTAGSGRVPAGLNNIVGLKPSKGLVSTAGVVPACRTLDCVSVFALTVDDATAALDAIAGFDAADPYSRAFDLAPAGSAARLAVPRAADLDWFGDGEAEKAFAAAVESARGLGLELVEVDISALLAAARLLYEGPWLAERYAAVGTFIEAHPDATHPITRAIVLAGRDGSAADAFAGFYRLEELKREAAPIWQAADALLVPTAPRAFTVAEIEAEPVRHNATLGRYTNFVNLMDLAALAVPQTMRGDGIPCGVTLLAPAGHDRRLAALGQRLHAASGLPLGATGIPQPAMRETAAPTRDIPLAVFGAHMQGLPLCKELLALGGRFVREATTAPAYRLYRVPGVSPARPGLVRVDDGGAAIACEIWALPPAGLGSLLTRIDAPLCIGTVELADGARLKGFLAEPQRLAGAEDITRHGGWRAYLVATATSS
jgi:allophanate hydrolase